MKTVPIVENDDDDGEVTFLDVGDVAASYCEAAQDHRVSLAALEEWRRTRVIADGREPGATADERFAALVELRRKEEPDLELAGLEALSYLRATNIPFEFTRQAFPKTDDELSEFVRRENLIHLASLEDAPPAAIAAGLTALEERTTSSTSATTSSSAWRGDGAVSSDQVTKMRAARAELRMLSGIQLSAAAMKYNRMFGADWQSALETAEASGA